MPSAPYYREQARLLLKWANETQEPGVARRLTRRAQIMLVLAQQALDGGVFDDVLELFNMQQVLGGGGRADQA